MDGVKRCVRCGVIRLIAEFHCNKNKSGHRYPHSSCKYCRNKAAVERRVANGSIASPSAWTPARISHLAQLNAKGLSASKIARELGVTKNQVIGRLWRTERAYRGGTTMAQRLNAMHAKLDAALGLQK